MGDILQLTPMLMGLRETYPEARIFFLTGEEFVPLVEGNPSVDAIVPIPEKTYRYLLKNSPERYPFIFNELYDLICDLRGVGFDLIVNRQYEWGAILAHLIGADRIVGGSYSPGRGFYFEDRETEALFDLIRSDRRKNCRNLADWSCRIAGAAPSARRHMHVAIDSSSRRQAQVLLGSKAGEAGALVAVQMGASRSFRRWGADHWVRVVEWLINEKRKRVILLGGGEEEALSSSVKSRLNLECDNIIDIIGKTSLKVAGAVLERCELLITGDTGPMHMAAAVGTPTLSAFAGTAYPWETGPYGPGHFVLYADIPCAPCIDAKSCGKGNLCKALVTPPLIIRAFEVIEALRQGRNLVWRCGETGPVRLMVTDRHADGEQILVDVDDLNDRHFLCDSFEIGSENLPGVIKSMGDEIIISFMEGNEQRGFSRLPDYLDHWMALKGAMSCPIKPLIGECMQALRCRDVVTLMDAIEYGFTPMLERVQDLEDGCADGR